MDTMIDQPLGKPEGTVRAYAALFCLVFWSLYYGGGLLLRGAPVEPPHPYFDEIILGYAVSYFGIRTVWTAKRVLSSMIPAKSGDKALEREDRIEELATALGVALRRAGKPEAPPVTPPSPTPYLDEKKLS